MRMDWERNISVGELLKLIVAFGCSYFALSRLGHFTDEQSSLLAVAALVFVRVILELSLPPVVPFHMTIRPMWKNILRDQGAGGLLDAERWNALFGPENKWDSLMESGDWESFWGVETSESYSCFRQGITITMLGPDLYYSNDHQQFFSKLEIAAEVPELLTPEERDNILAFAPRFYMKLVSKKSRRDGYVTSFEFGLRTKDSINNVQWAGEFPHNPEKGDIVLATLPKAVFSRYYGSEARRKKLPVEQLLKELGWTREDIMDGLQHKYVWISYDGI